MSHAKLTFEVPGEPCGKGRHRAVNRKGRGGKTFLAMLTPDKTIRYESEVALFAAQAMAGRPLLEGPLWTHVTAFYGRPKSHAKMNPQPQWVTKKPDASNVLKALEDAMNGVVYRDDCLLADVRVVRRWDDRPRVVVSIGLLDEDGRTCQTPTPQGDQIDR
jgi:Holliday junction resolvase RusA-like endonuclease